MGAPPWEYQRRVRTENRLLAKPTSSPEYLDDARSRSGEHHQRFLGIEAHYEREIWWRRPGGPPLFLPAVITDPSAPPGQLRAELARVREEWAPEPIGLWDCSGSLGLDAYGFERLIRNPWFLRDPGPTPPLGSLPRLDFEVATTRDQLIEFERANFAANEFDGLLARPPLSVHGAGTLDDPGVRYIMGRRDGAVVTSSVAYIGADMVGVYGIATDPAHRRRGYGTALIREIVALRPDLHVSTWPAPESVPMYTPFGFEPVGEVASWAAGPPGDAD